LAKIKTQKYRYFNQRCRKTYAIRLQSDMGNLFTINFPNLAMAHPYTKSKSHRQAFMVLSPIPFGSDNREITVESQDFQ